MIARNESGGKITLFIQGMDCASCVGGIEGTLSNIPGVQTVSVHFPSGKTSVYAEGVTEEELILAIKNLGYHATTTPKEKEGLPFWQVAISIVLTLPLLIQMFTVPMPRWVQLILATLVQFGAGWRFYIGAYYAAKNRTFSMDSLVVMGTTAAYVYSVVIVALRLPHELYFDASAIIITMVLLGKWLEARASGKASKAIEKLLNLQPKTARVERDGEVVEVPVSEIQVGDLFILRPGDRIPVDGEIVEGSSHIDESMLTGESMPVSKHVGDRLFTGTHNQHGSLKAKATQIGAHTALAEIIRLVEEAQTSKAPIQRLADKVASIFVPTVLGIALVTFIAWWIFGPFAEALINSVAVLVIACPCALGLAVPTVLTVATGMGASMGVLIKDASAIERANHLKSLVLDKTGTITEGKPAVTRFEGDDDLLEIAASLEQFSEHPLAAAILDKAEPLPAEAFEAVPGKGVKAKINGIQYYLGSPKFSGQETDANVVVWSDERTVGFIWVSDPVRPTSKEAVASIKSLGICPYMITGDHQKVANAVGKEVGITDVIAEVLPQDKAAEVKKLKAKGLVGMVGDGINDAPALAAADVGFAIGAGSDVALEAADLTLLRSDLTGAVDAIRLSKATFRKMWQNLFFAFIYNIIGIPIAAAGFLNPAIAGAAMALSSVCVVTNALLLKKTLT